MSERFRRLVDLLALLPHNGRSKPTRDLHRAIEDKGYVCDKRTVERDLAYLMDVYPTAISVDSKEHGYNNRTNYWQLKNHKGLLPESLLNDEIVALALALLKQQAFSRLPRRVFEALDQLWEQADATARQYKHAVSWMRLIQHLPDPLRPQPPLIDEAVQRIIEDALRMDNLLHVCVQTLDGKQDYKDLVPLRLLLQDEVLYLLAFDRHASTEEAQTRLIPMHRVLDATSTVNLDGPPVEADIAQSAALGNQGTICLKLRVGHGLATVLFNRPIGREQMLERCTDNPEQFIVTTHIDDTPQLRIWLARRMPSELEVIEPAGFPPACP